jgi:glycine/D-amino acid oxidase-like deaminating enzyme
MMYRTNAVQRCHVVIVGGRFGGLAAAKALKNSPFDVTLIDQHNYHLFQPLLYQVATAGLSPADIASPKVDILDMTFIESPSGIRERWHAGYADTCRALARAAWIGEFGPLDAVVLREPDPEEEHETTIAKLAAAAE